MQDEWYKVMAVSYARLRIEEPLAAGLLKIWSLLDCAAMSPELMLMGKGMQVERLSHVAEKVVTEADKQSLNSFSEFVSHATKSTVLAQIAVLRRYAMLPASQGAGSSQIHPMIRALCLQTPDSPAIDRHLLSVAVTLVAAMVRSFGQGRMLHGFDIGLPAYAQAIGALVSTLHFDEQLAIDCLIIAEYLERWEYSSELESLYLYAREAFAAGAGRNSHRATYKLAVLYHNQGHIGKAERKLMSLLTPFEAVHESNHDTYTLLSCELLGSIFTEREDILKAQDYLVRARAGFQRGEGSHSPSALRATRNVGHLALQLGWLELAERMFLFAREETKEAESLRASLQSDRLLAAPGLIETYMRSGRLDLAEQMALIACKEAEKLLGPNHASTFARYYHLALVYLHQGKLEHAKMSYDEAVGGRDTILSKDKIDIYATFVHLGTVSGPRWKYAQVLLYSTYEAFCALYPEDHPGPLVALTSLAHFFNRQGRRQLAETLAREALRRQIKFLGTDHELVPMTTFCLGMILRDQRKTYQAIERFIDAIQGLERFAASQRDLLLSAYHALSSSYRSKNMSQEATEVSRKLQQRYNDASLNSPADQQSLNEWLEDLRLTSPKQGDEADNDHYDKTVVDDFQVQPEVAVKDHLVESSVSPRAGLLRELFGAKSDN
jgi:tetratricopeptide (TPR) repeat protein